MYSATLKFKRSLSACSREFVQSRSRYYSMLIHAVQNLPPNATRRPTSLSLRLHPERQDCGSLKLLPSQVSTAGSIQDATGMPKHNSQRRPGGQPQRGRLPARCSGPADRDEVQEFCRCCSIGIPRSARFPWNRRRPAGGFACFVTAIPLAANRESLWSSP